ncbi:MAG: SUMF1/EgtB/PvdO family nonheme iron enzyme [Planctomycetota bacterium]
MKEQIKRIQEYVWARHVDGSDNYDHSIGEEEAIQTLDAFYSGIGNRNSPDQVYLGILLFEKAFEHPEQQEELFSRAKKIFDFYKRVTGEDDWPAVEDRLEDIEAFLGEGEEAKPEEPAAESTSGSTSGSEPVAVADEPAPAPVEEAPAAEEKAPDEPAPAEEPAAEEPVAEEAAPAPEQPPTPPPSAPAASAAAASAATPAADTESAAESEERRKEEERTARREATEAFIADLEMVDGMQLVPAGTFVYGAEDREMYLDSYYIDRLPVTNAQYMRFVQEMGYRAPRFANDDRLNKPEQPVVGISLGDAKQYARWAGKELPSEQQWEKASRGADGRPFPWGNDPPGASDACFGLDPATGSPAPVGQSLRNVSPFGVADTVGSVWEWTTSKFAKDSDFMVVRGGSYNDPPDMLRCDFRMEAHPKDKAEVVGFRCVKNIHHA